MKSTKKTLIFFAAMFATASFLTSCGGEKEEVEKATLLTTLSANAEDSVNTPDGRIAAAAHGGQFVYRTDSAHEYSATMRYDLHDSLINDELRVIVNFWAKTDNPVKGDGLGISFQDNEKCYVWATFEPISHGAKANEWINVIDSIRIPADQVSKAGLFIKTFAFNPGKKATMDIDDINITVKKIEKVTE